MYMIFTNEADCIACESQISTVGASKYEEAGYKIVDGEVEIAEGKQRIECWAIPTESYTDGRWSILSPIDRSPDFYDELVAGFDFEVLEELPEDWYEPIDKA